VIFAGAMFVSLIPMVVLVSFQRYFTTSVAATGGKE
jgi:multiple sugar transport system permease protein/putative chitobiose transport system permease protein